MTDEKDSRPRRLPSMERLVGAILWGGVAVSVFCIAAALLWQLASTSAARFDHAFPHTTFARFAAGELTLVVREGFTPGRLLNLGILVLLLTPYLRVVLSMVYFVFLERNVKYSLITGFVGAVLTCSLFLSP